MEEQKEASVTLKKSTLWMISTFVFAGLFVISLFTGGFGLGDNDATGNVIAPTGNVPTAPTPTKINVKIDSDDPVLGDSDAPITIVEFSDFQCPFCARAFSDAVTQLKNNEIKDGKVKLIYKDFPLTSIHPFAQKAAEAAQCAFDQGKFWEYHDILFTNQNALDTTSLKKYASDLDLDTDGFNTCLDSGEKTKEVSDDLTQATASGGRGTPYFVIMNENGDTIPVSGAQPYANFQAAISAVS